MLVERAEQFARLAHINQWYGDLPYYHNLKRVYLTLKDFEVTDKTLLAAGWLYRTLEDTNTTYDILLIQFGKEVADIVHAVTNEKGNSRKEILEKTAPKIRENSKAVLIKLADRIVNTEFSYKTNSELYKMYEDEYYLFREHLCNENDFSSITENAMWIYLTHFYLEDRSISPSKCIERAIRMERQRNQSLAAQFKDSPEKYLEQQLGTKILKIEDEDLKKKELYDEWQIHLTEYRKELDGKDEEYYKRLKKYRPLEYQEILDDWAIKKAEYREELREVERKKAEDKYWNDYYQMLDEREADYYDSAYQIVEEKMYYE